MGRLSCGLHRTWILAVVMLAVACGAGVEATTSFDFTVETLPYRTEVSAGDIIEIDLAIVSDGEWSGERYSLRYFRDEGTGWLTDEESNLIKENAQYVLPLRSIALAYHTCETGSEHFTIWISDSAGNEQETEFSIEAK